MVALVTVGILASLSLWVALSVALGVILGRMIQDRDLQVPARINSSTEFKSNYNFENVYENGSTK